MNWHPHLKLAYTHTAPLGTGVNASTVSPRRSVPRGGPRMFQAAGISGHAHSPVPVGTPAGSTGAMFDSLTPDADKAGLANLTMGRGATFHDAGGNADFVGGMMPAGMGPDGKPQFANTDGRVGGTRWNPKTQTNVLQTPYGSGSATYGPGGHPQSPLTARVNPAPPAGPAGVGPAVASAAAGNAPASAGAMAGGAAGAAGAALGATAPPAPGSYNPMDPKAVWKGQQPADPANPFIPWTGAPAPAGAISQTPPATTPGTTPKLTAQTGSTSRPAINHSLS